ncbi:hypoxanthine phosphoribosyltransferase [Alginatibacterium sediminis]|uniref:Hypoxanthine phosphoribosyltransferase n=1 Tax=Alginatibacterium sediminis TaxID=2164068 RepID=A0A420E9L7_9ALTE|nr:hypoxanthine phosphoribosyltransferase [Alginatibacterium sediminis]RKF15862.1 hypoxanthine phosphoribosyltransferase [Alginatibacterium sediminis]
MKHRIEEMISADAIAQQVQELGKKITAEYSSERKLVLVGLLRGSIIFMSDLARAIDRNMTLDFMTVSSYGSGTESTRDVRVLKDLDDDIRDCDVLIVEDIIDTGYTLSKVREMLEIREPHSLAICTLLDKPSRREVEVPVDYVGFEIPDEFVVGYGLDFDQIYRNLPFVGKVIPTER